MTQLPDIDNDSWRSFEADDLRRKLGSRIDSMGFMHDANERINSLTMPSSDSLTNPLGTGHAPPPAAPPVAEPEPLPAPVEVPPPVPDASASISPEPVAPAPPPLPAPVPPIPAPSAPPVSPPGPVPSAGGGPDLFGSALSAAVQAGADARTFAADFAGKVGSADPFGAALGSAHAAGADIGAFAQNFRPPPEPTPPPAAVTTPSDSLTSPLIRPTPGGADLQPGGDLRAFARQAAAKYGIDPDIFERQIQQESGFRTSAQSPAGATGIAQFMPGTAKGMGIDPNDPYAALDAAARLDAQNLNRYGSYDKMLAAYNAGGGNVDKYGGVPPFEETQRYVKNIMAGAGEAIGGAASALGTSARGALGQISQFGDSQLSADEAYSACGPAAAVRFAQMYGRNPTLREATDLARTVGWTSASGMAGLTSEAALMAKMGVPTKMVGADWSTLAREAKSGNPVTISTPGHYFTADGYDPSSGAFHVGRSGTDLKGGSEWMTPAQMETRMGALQGGLLADHPNVPAPSLADNAGSFLDRTRSSIVSRISGDLASPDSAVNKGIIGPLQEMLTGARDEASRRLDDAVKGAGSASLPPPGGLPSDLQPTRSPLRGFSGGMETPPLEAELRNSGLARDAGLTAAAVGESSPLNLSALGQARDAIGEAKDSVLRGDTSGALDALNRAGASAQESPLSRSAGGFLGGLGEGLQKQNEDAMTTNPLDTLLRGSTSAQGKWRQGDIGGGLSDIALAAAAAAPRSAALDADLSAPVATGLERAGVPSPYREILGFGANLALPTGEGLARGGIEATEAGVGRAARALESPEVQAALRARQRGEGVNPFAAAADAFRRPEEGPRGAPPPDPLRGVADDFDKILTEREAASAPRGKPALPEDVDRVLNSLGAKVNEHWFDRRGRLQAVEQYLEQQTGKPLALKDKAWMRSRLYEGRQDSAYARLQDEVGPQLEAVNRNPEDMKILDAYLEQMDNADKSRALATREQSRIADTDIGPVKGQADLDRANAAVQQAEAAHGRAQVMGNETTEQIMRDKLERAQRVQARAQERYDAEAQTWKDAQAKMAGIEGGRVYDRREFSGGATGQEHDLINAHLEDRVGPARAEVIKSAANAVWDSTRAMRERKVNAGTLDPELADVLARDFPHYNPIRILDHMSDQQIENLPLGGRIFGGASDGIKKLTAEGTTAARQSPLSSFVDSMFRTEEMTRRNEVVRSVAGWADHPQLANFVKKVEEGDELPKGYTAVSYLDGAAGKQRVAVPDQLAQTLSLDPLHAGLIGNIMSGLSLPLRAGATALRPSFIAFNAVNDALWSLYRFAVEAPNPAEGVRAMSDLAHGYHAAFGGDPELVQAARKAGGMQGIQSRFDDPDSILRQLAGEHNWVRKIETPKDLNIFREETRRQLGTVGGAIGDVAGLAWSRPLNKIGGPVELAPRLAAYRRAIRQGATEEEAALKMRTTTADFAAGGRAAKQLNNMLPFLNATSQATGEFGRLSKDRPIQSTVAQATILAGIIASEIYNRSVAPDDYADVTRKTRSSGLVIMDDKAPEGDGKRGLGYLPLRGGLGLMVPLVREAMGRMYGDKPQTWQALAKQVLGQVSPVEPDIGGLTGFLPAIPKLAQELQANYDSFRDQPIVPKSLEGLPPSYQFTPTTSQTARALAGSSLPFVGQKPAAAIDYAIKGFSPGPGEALLGATDAVLRTTGHALPEPSKKGEAGARDVPLVGGILGRFLRTTGSEQQSEAYDAASQLADDRRNIALDSVVNSDAYKNATPDRQTQMLRELESELQAQTKDLSGIEKDPKDLGFGPKYAGVDDPKQEQKIDRAVSKWDEWRAHPGSAPEPNDEETLLARAYRGKANPYWSAEQKVAGGETSEIRQRVREAVGATSR
jgi:hypothetical protein